MRVCDFIERCNEANSPEQVFGLFCSAVQDWGYDRIGLIPATPAAGQALNIDYPKPAAMANVPGDWLSHYFHQGYQSVDPILLRTPLHNTPLIWDDLLSCEAISPKQKRILMEGIEAGLLNGVSFPLHGPAGESYIVSLAMQNRDEPNSARFGELRMMAVQFLLAYAELVRPDFATATPLDLTERERECLTWTARGKSAWSIGKILSVSEHTVNFHLKNAMGKLRSANRMQAVVTAIRCGMILP